MGKLPSALQYKFVDRQPILQVSGCEDAASMMRFKKSGLLKTL